MQEREIILSEIASIISKPSFMYKENGIFRELLKCSGLGEYYEKYSATMEPYYFNGTWKNPDEEYNVFISLDNIFTDLFKESKEKELIKLLSKLPEFFHVYNIENEYIEEVEKLNNLYSIFGLELEIKDEKYTVKSYFSRNEKIIKEQFNIENWLFNKFPSVYESYSSAIHSLEIGDFGAAIESCRTTLTGVFSEYRGTDGFAKWIRGAFNIENDDGKISVEMIKTEIDKSSKSLADFFIENPQGELKKTKAIYSIYSFMSDYGTHRNESTKEVPKYNDALMSLKFLESILMWIYLNR